LAQHLFRCHGCGRKFPHRPGAGLDCSPRCEKKRLAELAKAEAALKKNGFAAHPKAANAFTKDGVTVTREQVRKHGLAKVLEAHQTAAA